MSLTILVSLLVCIIGAFVFALATNGKAVELGKLSFFAGLLVTLLHVGATTFSLR